MPKKDWTPEERAAFGAKMKAAKSAKNKNPQTNISNQVPGQVAPMTVGYMQVEDKANQTRDLPEEVKETIEDTSDYEALLRRVQELESQEWRKSRENQDGLSTANGRVTGTFEKFPMEAAFYPDPTSRLSAEAKLRHFAFPMNYELEFLISESAYTTIDGIRTKEPKFTLELIRIILDEETGDPTEGRYIICRLIMHEDPDAALAIAREQGIEVADIEEQSFLDEMRYLRMRDWLIECFYPPKPAPEKNKRDMVIDGKLVEYFEVQSETTQSVPFGELKNKL